MNIPSVASPSIAISPSTVSNLYRGEGPPDNISNAILSPFHASTTESILSWPHFGEFRNLIKESKFSVFHLENKRKPLAQRALSTHPYMTKREIEKTIRSFERGINFWYPTMTKSTTKELQTYISSGTIEENTRSCLSLLVMAMGCASDLVELSTTNEIQSTEAREIQNQQRLLSEIYFGCAFKKISLAQAEFTADAVQCLFFTG